MKNSHGLFLAIVATLSGLCFCLALIAGILLITNISLRLQTGQALAMLTATQTSSVSIPALTGTQPAVGTLTPPPTMMLTPTTIAESSASPTTDPNLLTPPLPPESLTPGPEAGTPLETETPFPSATIGPLAMDAWCVPWNRERIRAQVERVVDGVSIEVTMDGQLQQVRYIGIDLLEYESDPTLWQQAYEQNRQLVEGKDVLLARDRSDVDSEGRLLRYVLAGPVFINQEMVASGYAAALSMPPDTSCDQVLLEAQKQAILQSRGLWAATPTPTRTFIAPTPTASGDGDVVIVKVSVKGTIWQEPEEYVEIYNAGTTPVQMLGWTLRDEQSHIFVFPELVMKPGDFCRVYTNLYREHQCGLSFYSQSPIWHNEGECAFLKDAQGTLVSQLCPY